MVLTFTSCNDKDPTDKPIDLIPIENALAEFVQTLQSIPPTREDLSDRVKTYLLAQPTVFFGSTVTLLDSVGKATYSPYWYRTGGSLTLRDLAEPSYLIDEQAWLRDPIDTKMAVWTEPYFDAGGGEIWMRTRSVPVIVNDTIIALATTDVEVDEP
jgi:hypothetical protein